MKLYLSYQNFSIGDLNSFALITADAYNTNRPANYYEGSIRRETDQDCHVSFLKLKGKLFEFELQTDDGFIEGPVCIPNFINMNISNIIEHERKALKELEVMKRKMVAQYNAARSNIRQLESDYPYCFGLSQGSSLPKMDEK